MTHGSAAIDGARQAADPFAGFADLFDQLDREEQSSWHADAPDKDPRAEDARVLEFLGDLHHHGFCGDVFGVPNAGKRTWWETYQRTKEGMKAGALDLVLTWTPTTFADRGVGFMEWKDGKSGPTPNQSDRLDMYVRQGHHCGLFRRSDSAIAALRGWGAPFLTQALL